MMSLKIDYKIKCNIADDTLFSPTASKNYKDSHEKIGGILQVLMTN